jgi:hypothetical protein
MIELNQTATGGQGLCRTGVARGLRLGSCMYQVKLRHDTIASVIVFVVGWCEYEILLNDMTTATGPNRTEKFL